MGVGHLHHMPGVIAIVFQCLCRDKGGGVATHHRQFAVDKNRVMSGTGNIEVGQALGYYSLYFVTVPHFRLGTMRRCCCCPCQGQQQRQKHHDVSCMIEVVHHRHNAAKVGKKGRTTLTNYKNRLTICKLLVD